ncbi:hypothetical protein PoB_005450500 [Plakobranchus ocellatus]|uniref:Uncharacterized protein n=1 Tax=Plakobranchus ocellatus TaxID=259542 RepID=A0AAV4C5K7_9GAST|nr:hypothetical protein PoB_005450500 [Plakobranchus ocellatus]
MEDQKSDTELACESGVDLNINDEKELGGGICRVLAPKGDKRVYQITNDNHRQVTVLACGNAAGDMQQPLLIFPGQRFAYDPLAGFREAHIACSANGWIDSTIF